MPTESERRSESELRAALHGRNDAPAPSIDANEVIRRARRRRSPRQIAVGSVTALAVAAIVVVGVNAGQLFPRIVGAASDSASAPESATSGGALGGPADLSSGKDTGQSLNKCGSETPNIPSNSLKLAVDVSFPASVPANGQTVKGTVTLINTGTERVTGVTRVMPIVAVSQGGLIVWHSRIVDMSSGALVDLGPGQSKQFRVGIQLVTCSPDDDSGGGFSMDLPELAPGSYQVGAVVSLVLDGRGTEQLISGPAAEIVLR